MSNKSGVADQVISLPTGGGAMQGIGESFSPDLFTGTGNLSIPIALPPGRTKLQPELTLTYSTGSGNGPYGLGWSLSGSGVTRKTSKGVPRYDENVRSSQRPDVFSFAGSEDLVPVLSVPDRTEFRPRTEGAFARIVRHHDSTEDYWEIFSKDGLVSIHGTPKQAGTDPAVVADPSKRSKVFAWRTSEVRDPYGSRILYEYVRDSGEEGPHRWDQLYYDRIRYADYRDAGGDTEFLVEVIFHYEDRPDPFSSYGAGFEIRTRKRCVRIDTRTSADVSRLVRTYHFVYLDQRPGFEDTLPQNGASILSQVRVTGHDGDSVEELPPLEFTYSRFQPETRRFFPLAGRDLPAISLAHPDLELADLFGRGLPDVVQMNGSVRYWRNRGNGEFDLPRDMTEAPAGLRLADPGVQMLDADGDGRIDLMVTTPTLAGFFPLGATGEWDRGSFRRYDVAPTFNLEDPSVRLIDLDGDGVTDAIRSGSRLEYFFNDPAAGWNEVRTATRRSLDEFPNVDFADNRVRFADMTGDGPLDVVLLFDGNVEYWPNLGHGNWGRRVHMENSPRFPAGYDPRRILIGDVDGDGLADIVYVDNTHVLLFVNQSGNRWSDALRIEGTPPVTDMDAVRLVDVLGTGVAGILWSADRNDLARDSLFFLDLAGGVKPYLLDVMNNHRGAVTRVRYEPSTRFFVADQQRAQTRWKTSLPFPVLVVSRVEIVDEISGSKHTVEYSYHHGYFDGVEREFRGFGRVDQRDTQTFVDYHQPSEAGAFVEVPPDYFSPVVLTRTWFHQGPIGDEFGFTEPNFDDEYFLRDPSKLLRPPDVEDMLRTLPRRARRDAIRALRGRILRTELYALDGSPLEQSPYTVTEFLYGIRHEFGPTLLPDPSTALSPVEGFFAHPLAKRTTQWERGDEPMTQVEFSGDYDAFGQSREQVAIACPRGWRELADVVQPDNPFLATASRTVFAVGSGGLPFIADRIARVTTFELTHSGPATLDDLRATAATAGADAIINQTLTFYDGDAFVGLPFGEVGPFGAAVRTETLVLTEDILNRAYVDDTEPGAPVRIPPYLDPGGPPPFTDEYPAEFRQLAPLAGYVFHDGTGPETRGFFATESARFDFHSEPDPRGMPLARRNALGHETRIAYDAFQLLPTTVTDRLGLERRVDYDYRVLQPSLVIDTNGNRSQFSFSPLGFLVSIALMGRDGEALGDTPEVPGTRMEYDFMAFANSPPGARRPMFVRTIQREFHVQDPAAPPDRKDAALVRIEFSDGFGRVIQTRSSAQRVRFGTDLLGLDVIPEDQSIEPGPSRGRVFDDPSSPAVVVSGHQVFDNKGRVVEQYEPFFSTGFDFAVPTEEQRAAKALMFYDPRGQLVRTINPDGSIKRVIFGIPKQLDTPDDFTPTPWEAYTYDANDNADLFQGPHHVDPSHVNTPGTVVIDALGRVVTSVARLSASEAHIVRSIYDVRGNVVRVVDPFGRTACSYVYDLSASDQKTSRVLREESIDAGTRRIVCDALGREIERRDSKSALTLQAYDAGNRPRRLWARDGADRPVTLRQRFIYGDDAGVGDPPVANTQGRLRRHFDEAGVIEISRYDFKGNVVAQSRRAIADSAFVAAMGGSTPTFQVDWDDVEQEAALDVRVYQTDGTFDALNRILRITLPEDVSGDRKTIVPSYGANNALERVNVLEQNGAVDRPFVVHIAYNARGQRGLIAYANGLMTRHAYDAGTFQVSRLRTERYEQEGPFDFVPAGGLLQDIGYEHDLVGNITRARERSPGTGVPGTILGPDALDREFQHDALYRLVSATGREHNSRNPSSDPWLDEMSSTGQDAAAVRTYTREYDCDRASNVTACRHLVAGSPGSFTRTFTLESGSNRLTSTVQGSLVVPFSYDAAGNLTAEDTSRRFDWNHSNRLARFRIQPGNATPSIDAYYAYDASGQRVKKVVRRQDGRVSSITYVGNSFEHHRDGDDENTLVVVQDVTTSVAQLRVGQAFPGDEGPPVQYFLPDHIHNSNVVVDQSGAFVRREEFYPYGGTSFGSFARKRYRFTGKERDEESGLSYHRARYYAPFLAKWVSPDPAGSTDGLNLYAYGRNNPIRFYDASGNDTLDVTYLGSTNYHPWQISIVPDKAGENRFLKFFEAAGHYLWAGVKWTAKFDYQVGRHEWSWTWSAMKTMWSKGKDVAGSIWSWAKDHTLIASGIALGVAVIAFLAKKSLWEWVLAPAIRIASNAAFGYAMFGKWGAIAGAVLGGVHGFAMAKAGSYDWTGNYGLGWAAFIADNTWSLANSFIGSVFAASNIFWNDIDEATSRNSNSLYFTNGWIPGKDTTLGNVTVGTSVPLHESVHAYQARVLGPLYVPSVLVSYEIAFVVPYWLLYDHCSVTGFGSYIMQGVYPNTWHELMAYGIDSKSNAC